MINQLTNIIPEAKPIVDQVAKVYLKHTKPWFIGLVVHGSAVKGGFVKGCSDIDFQLYLEDSIFDEYGQLPLSLCISIHEDLSKIEPYPFRYIQFRVSAPSFKQYGGLVTGTYQLVSGRLLLPEATNQELLDRANNDLTKLNPSLTFLSSGLLDHGEGRLQRNVRGLCTVVYPVLFQILTIIYNDGIKVWRLTKKQAIDQLQEENRILGQKINEFYYAVLRYYPDENSVNDALAVIDTGVEFLNEAKKWWKTHG